MGNFRNFTKAKKKGAALIVAPNEEKFYTLTSLTKQLLYTING
jgi:hypothetical protein